MEERLKILYISQAAGGGGAPRSLARLVESLDKSIYEPILILGKSSKIEPVFCNSHLNIYFKNLISFGVTTHSPNISIVQFISFLFHFIPDIITIYRIIKKEKVDIVHINSSVLIVQAIACRLAGIKKIIWHIREVIPDSKFGNLQIRLINHISSNIIAISKQINMQFCKSKTIQIYNGIDHNNFKPNLDIETIKKQYGLKEEMIFTFIGKITPVKGAFIFLQAAAIVIKYGYNVKFFFIGDDDSGSPKDGIERRIKNIIKNILRYKRCNWKEKLEIMSVDLGISDKTIFTGFRNDVPNFISLSNAIIVPNLQSEGFGLVLIESAALRKPVISTNIPPTPEIVIHGKTGILLEPGNVEALAQAMIYIIDNPVQAKEMGENAYKRIEENFHINMTYRRIMELYENMIKP